MMEGRKDVEADAPETVNNEQEDGGQVLDAADMLRSGETMPVGESDHAHRSNASDVVPDDVPDIVDRMEQMVSSGHIDNGAFDGEPVHDDEEDILGDTGVHLDDDEGRAYSAPLSFLASGSPLSRG